MKRIPLLTEILDLLSSDKAIFNNCILFIIHLKNQRGVGYILIKCAFVIIF